MINAVLRLVFGALLLSGATMVSAADFKNWYAGLGIGYSHAELYPADFNFNFPQTTEDHKYYDSGYKIFAGYQFNKLWAVEASYVTLGKFQYRYNDAGFGSGFTSNYKVTGFGLAAVPMVPLGDTFAVFGKLGFFSSQARRTRTNETGIFNDGTQSIQQVNAISPLLGAGVQINFGQDLGMRIEYENYGKVGDTFAADTGSPGRANVQMTSVSVVLRF